MDRQHCYTHDVDYPPNSQCPICRQEEIAELQREAGKRDEEALRDKKEQEQEHESQAELRHEELLELNQEAIYKRSNPGEFECPGCLYITLKRNSKRCPTCHESITAEHWEKVAELERRVADAKREAEQKAAEASRIAWELGEPERQRKAKLAKEQELRLAEQKRRSADQAKNLLGWVSLYKNTAYVVLTLGCILFDIAAGNVLLNVHGTTNRLIPIEYSALSRIEDRVEAKITNVFVDLLHMPSSFKNKYDGHLFGPLIALILLLPIVCISKLFTWNHCGSLAKTLLFGLLGTIAWIVIFMIGGGILYLVSASSIQQYWANCCLNAIFVVLAFNYSLKENKYKMNILRHRSQFGV